MMRRRTRWAGYVVLGVSALWLVVVCLYSIGVDRECKRLAARLDALERRPAPKPCNCASQRLQAPEEASQAAQSALLPPRIEGTGRSGRYRYADVLHPDGERRRYYLATNATPQQVSAWLLRLQSDAVDHQPVAEGVRADSGVP